jgi:hypothetical protein
VVVEGHKHRRIIENGPPPSHICSEGGDGSLVVVEGQKKVGICGIRLVEDGVGAGDVA